MHNHNAFILRNLLKVRDKHWSFDTDALDNLVDALRDELWNNFEKLPEAHHYHDVDQKEIAFESRARKLLLSLFTPHYDYNT